MEPGSGQAEDGGSARELQLHGQYRRVFCLTGQEVLCSENVVRGAERPAGIPAGAEGQAPQIWRGDRVSARRRWGRSQDYGTIPSLRFEEAGREVRATGESVSTADGEDCALGHPVRRKRATYNYESREKLG